MPAQFSKKLVFIVVAGPIFGLLGTDDWQVYSKKCQTAAACW